MFLKIQESYWSDAISRSLSLVAAKSPWIIWLLFVKSDFLNLVFFTKHLSNEILDSELNYATKIVFKLEKEKV